MHQSYYSIGLMSGTSMDGIDASIICSDGELKVDIIDEIYFPYDQPLKKRLRNTIKKITSKKQLFSNKSKLEKLENDITLFHAKVCKILFNRNKNLKIDIIGFHGHTILHKPNCGYSIQIGKAELLSKILKKKIISCFRAQDIKKGGQGAPLAPIYHDLILKKNKINLPAAIINIGGISNITYLDKDEKLYAFDIGPGNCLIDEWIKIKTKKNFDKNGNIAKKGITNEYILKNLLQNYYFKKKQPKSLDIKNFNLKEIKKLNFKDGASTLSMFTVYSIVNAIKKLKHYPKKILISGGGRKNNFIMQNLKLKIKCPVHLIDKYKLDGDYIESQAFGYLAIRSYLKKNLTFPNTTGVSSPTTGGEIFMKY